MVETERCRLTLAQHIDILVTFGNQLVSLVRRSEEEIAYSGSTREINVMLAENSIGDRLELLENYCPGLRDDGEIIVENTTNIMLSQRY